MYLLMIQNSLPIKKKINLNSDIFLAIQERTIII